eukprot:753972-Hanusia_phi.AAC.1
MLCTRLAAAGRSRSRVVQSLRIRHHRIGPVTPAVPGQSGSRVAAQCPRGLPGTWGRRPGRPARRARPPLDSLTSRQFESSRTFPIVPELPQCP